MNPSTALNTQALHTNIDLDSSLNLLQPSTTSNSEGLSHEPMTVDTPSPTAISPEFESIELNFPHDLLANTNENCTPRPKKKSLEEQKRRRNETDSQAEMELALRRVGYPFVGPRLSAQNTKVSGLGNAKQEIMEEYILYLKELEDARAADARLVGQWWKLSHQMKLAPRLLMELKTVYSRGFDRHQLERAQRDLAWKLQTLIPPRYLEIILINATNDEVEASDEESPLGTYLHPLQKRFRRTIRSSSAEQLQGLLIDLEEIAKGESAKWPTTLKRLVLRLLQLKLRLFGIEKGARLFIMDKRRKESRILLWNLASFVIWPNKYRRSIKEKSVVRRASGLRAQL